MTGIIGKISSRSKIVNEPLTDGGILLGSGPDAITATAVLADSEMLVGDGTTDPAIESGATLRTSIGLGSGSAVTFTTVDTGQGANELYDMNQNVLTTSGVTHDKLTATTGVLFGTDTAAANTLDDYEEGTWTPTWISTSATFSYSTQVGTYTKIGRIVHVSINLVLSGIPGGTKTNNLNLGPLPFSTSSSQMGGISIGGFNNFNIPSTEAIGDTIVGRISVSTNTIEMAMVEDNGALVWLSAAALTGATVFYANATYIT